jgi:hypothetical protein
MAEGRFFRIDPSHRRFHTPLDGIHGVGFRGDLENLGGRDVIYFGIVKGNIGQPSPSIERGGLGVQSHLFSDGPINIQHPDFRHGGSSMSRSIWFLWD